MLFKTSINSSIYYDNVRVPKEYRLAGPGMDANVFGFATAGAGWHSTSIALGIAERAFEIVLDYTGTRMGGGKPVRQHSMVAGMIADMEEVDAVQVKHLAEAMQYRSKTMFVDE